MHQFAHEVGRPTALRIDGLLVTGLDLERRPTRHEPLDHVWLFRSSGSWTVLTLRRTERWTDEGERAGGSARVFVEEMASLDVVHESIRDQYGESGWRDLLDAAHTEDPELFRKWVPIQVERDLDRAVFYRPDLSGTTDSLVVDALADLRHEIAGHLRLAGFEVVAVVPPARRRRRGENVVLAQAIVRRYGFELATIVRIDDAGEVYPRLADADDLAGPTIRELGDDDA